MEADKYMMEEIDKYIWKHNVKFPSPEDLDEVIDDVGTVEVYEDKHIYIISLIL